MKKLQQFGHSKCPYFRGNGIIILSCLFLLSNGKLNGRPVVELSVTPPGTILFEVRKDADSPVSYLFGTHHAFGKSFFESLPKAKEKLLSSQLLITETKHTEASAVSIINARNEVTQWKNYLNKENLAFVQKLLGPSELDFEKVNPAELFALTNRYYTENACKTKSEQDPRGSLDDYIYSLAKENELKAMGLETPGEQLELIREDIAGMPRRIHRKRLNSLFDELKSGNTGGCAEARKYTEMCFAVEADKPCANHLMLTNRNEKWLTIIEEKLGNESCFIAVGLSHLMYQCGLINQLRKKGYSILAVPVY